MKRNQIPAPKNSRAVEAAPAIADWHEGIDPVWPVYFDGRPMQTSRATCGFSLEEWQTGGKEFVKRHFSQDSVERLRVATQSMRRTGQALHNIEVRNKDGRRSHRFLVNYLPIFDAAQQVVGMRGDVRDITELRQLEFTLGLVLGLYISTAAPVTPAAPVAGTAGANGSKAVSRLLCFGDAGRRPASPEQTPSSTSRPPTSAMCTRPVAIM